MKNSFDGAVANKKWDFIVVGAGTVGLFVCSILAEKGASVLCFEGGGKEFSQDAQKLNDAIVSGLHHVGISDARARVLGGTSTLWGGQLARFAECDFSARPEIGLSAWPIDYSDVSEWYDFSAKYLGVGSYEEDYDGTLRKIFKDDVPFSNDIEFYATHWLNIPNISVNLKKRLLTKRNLEIFCNSVVVDLLFSVNKDSLDGVVVCDSDGNRNKVFARNVILSNGTMEISRLLLTAAQSYPDSPVGKNKNIGKYFQDHLDVDCGSVVVSDKKKFGKFFENALVAGSKVQPKLRLSEKSVVANGILNVGASVRFSSSLDEDLIYLKTMIKSFRQSGQPINFLELFKRAKNISGIWGPLVVRYLKDKRIMALMDGSIYVRAHMEQRPLFDSKISLSGEVDKFGVEKIKLDWRVDWDVQMKTLVKFCDGIEDFMLKNNFGVFSKKDFVIEQDIKKLSNECRDSFHQCGGAVMSKSEDCGVVDSYCRVHGVKNLYVAGAAVFPSSSYANPTFTAFALAARMVNYVCSS